MPISYLLEIISPISEFIGLPPLVFTCAVGLFVFLFVFALLVIHKLRSIKKELIEVNRSLYIFGQPFKHPAASLKGKEIDPSEMDADADDKPKIKIQKQTRAHPAQEDFQRQSYPSGGEAGKMTAVAKKIEIEQQGLSEKWQSNPDIRRKIIDQLTKTGRAISYHDIARQLSLVYPESDYDSALNELDQLEKEGEIEGHLGAGKLYYKINHG